MNNLKEQNKTILHGQNEMKQLLYVIAGNQGHYTAPLFSKEIKNAPSPVTNAPSRVPFQSCPPTAEDMNAPPLSKMPTANIITAVAGSASNPRPTLHAIRNKQSSSANHATTATPPAEPIKLVPPVTAVQNHPSLTAALASNSANVNSPASTPFMEDAPPSVVRTETNKAVPNKSIENLPPATTPTFPIPLHELNFGGPFALVPSPPPIIPRQSVLPKPAPTTEMSGITQPRYPFVQSVHKLQPSLVYPNRSTQVDCFGVPGWRRRQPFQSSGLKTPVHLQQRSSLPPNQVQNPPCSPPIPTKHGSTRIHVENLVLL